MSRAIKIEETAATYLARKEWPDWSDTDQAELDAWLAASPEHLAAYWRLEATWRRADRLSALKSPLAPVQIKQLFQGQGPLKIFLVAAMLVIGMLFILYKQQFVDPPEMFRTPVGGHQVAPLADGSRIELNTATEVRASVKPGRREVWLDDGEAFFDIAHDPNHPFVVHAGARRITVLGTKFSVRRTGDRVEVAVMEGRVQVDDTHTRRPAPAVILAGGDLAIASGTASVTATRMPERVEDKLSWREGRLTFTQTRLSDAVDEFNRYNAEKIVIHDPTIANITVSGSFEARDLPSFVYLLRHGLGLHVDENEGNMTISQ